MVQTIMKLGKNTKVSLGHFSSWLSTDYFSHSCHFGLPSQAAKIGHFRKEVLVQARKGAHARQNPYSTPNRHILRILQSRHRNFWPRSRFPKPTRRSCINVARCFPQGSRIPEPLPRRRLRVPKPGGTQFNDFELFQILV